MWSDFPACDLPLLQRSDRSSNRYQGDGETAGAADPLLDNPAYGTKYYRVNVFRLIGAIFLGVGSDDGNLMLIRPKGWKQQREE